MPRVVGHLAPISTPSGPTCDAPLSFSPCLVSRVPMVPNFVNVLTAKILLWDPTVRITRGLEVLLKLWLRTKSPLDCNVREPRRVSRLFQQNDRRENI
jgi:hypothetical protein